MGEEKQQYYCEECDAFFMGDENTKKCPFCGSTQIKKTNQKLKTFEEII